MTSMQQQTDRAATMDDLFAKVIQGLNAQYVGTWSIERNVDDVTRVLRSPRGVLCRVKGATATGREWNVRTIEFDDFEDRKIWASACRQVLHHGAAWTHMDSVVIYCGSIESHIIQSVVNLIGRVLSRIEAVNVVAMPLIEQRIADTAARTQSMKALAEQLDGTIGDITTGVVRFSHGVLTVSKDGSSATVKTTRPLPGAALGDALAALLVPVTSFGTPGTPDGAEHTTGHGDGPSS